ncbi:MAG: Ti-type conjugative transfer relaxase TraA [Pseudorhizobium sp.]
MAIYLCKVNQIGRRSGRNAVAAAAYRSATKLLNERDGLTYNYTNKKGVELAEVLLPDGVNAQWALDRELLWNTAERCEKRKDARVATEVLVALPHELAREEYTSLTREFAQGLANCYRAAIDVAIHRPSGETDERNIHAHLLMTTRTVSAQGLHEKTWLHQRNAWLLERGLSTNRQQLLDIRQTWEHNANRYLARTALDVRIDHRSYVARGIEIEPTQHMGVSATQMARQGLPVSRARIEEEASLRNAELIQKRPDQVLRLITQEKSVFDRYDIARALHRYIHDAQGFHDALAAAMASPTLVMLCPERDGAPARYSTREMIGVEHTMIAGAVRMAETAEYQVDRKHVERALLIQNDLIKEETPGQGEEEGNDIAKGEVSGSGSIVEVRAKNRTGLSDEQGIAIRHITGPEQIAAVVGFAGADKSTMLAAARDAWQRQGFRVHGAALAGIAAEGLHSTSGIESRTLASWEYGWQDGKRLLGKGDILVVDEAGMIASHQLARLIMKSGARGAKLVLVADYEPHQAIGAGSPFRAVVERIGGVELAESRRQKQAWQREATIAFATQRTGEGLVAYADRGRVKVSETTEEARADLVRDYVADLEAHPAATRIALAHRRSDVHALSEAIRASLQEQGRVAGKGQKNPEPLDRTGSEFLYQTIDGSRRFALGDRIIFLKNNQDLRVKNGMLGTVQAVEQDAIRVRLDSAGQGRARVISVPVRSYRSFDHGYATTIHKAQGSTVDRAFVVGSRTMDRHLTYVAMSRHRFDVQLHISRDDFSDIKVLAASLSRSGAKEGTLDYINTFAERRGLAEKPDRDNLMASHRLGARDGRASANKAIQRVKSKVDRVASDYVAFSVAEGGRGGQGGAVAAEKVEPLLPPLNKYDQSIEDVARNRAIQYLRRDLEAVRTVGRRVYVDPEAFVSGVAAALVGEAVENSGLAKSVALRPEQFGTLRGKAGLLGENKERKAARRDAVALSKLVASAGKTWRRRLDEERSSETWEREKRDVIAIPGLTKQSEAILTKFSRLSQADKLKFLERLQETVDGKQALKEAVAITRAIEKRFGSSESMVKKEELRWGSISAAKVTRISEVARMAEELNRAEVNRLYVAERSLDKKIGLVLGF